MLVSTDEGDDSDRDGTECVRALRGAGAAACGVSPLRSRGRPAGDRLARVRESSLHSLKEPEECASPIKPVSSSVSKMRQRQAEAGLCPRQEKRGLRQALAGSVYTS
jgi:hypothetical protein